MNLKTFNKKRGHLVLLLLISFAGHVALSQTSRWWSLGLLSCGTHTEAICPSCSEVAYLADSQKDKCRTGGNSAMVHAISAGTLAAIRDCQAKFSNWRWNCTTLEGEHLFGKFVEECTRERAVLNAYMSAGATRGIAKACKANQLGCTCEASLTSFVGGETYLHSCGEDVAFAIKFLKGFLTSIAGFSTFCSNCSSFSNAIVPTLSTSPIPTPGPTLSTSQCGPNCCKLAIDVHNDRVGYESLNNRTQYCRCTGLSGSCTLQTCYLRALAIEEVGAKLRVKYDGAQKVRCENSNLTLATNPPSQSQPPSKDGLVYMTDTPNLCDPIENMGILGVAGRKCDPFSYGTDGCNVMCCGYGYNHRTREVPVTSCWFKWCCKIECAVIRNDTVTEYWCNPKPPNNG